MMNQEDELHDLEDYSSKDIADEQHDQLPSVDEVKINAKSTSGHKRSLIIYGVVLVVLIIIGIIVGTSRRSSKNAMALQGPTNLNITAALHDMAMEGEADFQDKDSYQYAAMWDMVQDDMLETYTFEKLKQRYALYCLYHATSPEFWKNDKGFKRMGKDECKWFGVTCNEVGMVTRVGLRNNGLTGEIPKEVSLIPELKVFNVNANDGLSGSIHWELCMKEKWEGLDIKVDCDNVYCKCCSNCPVPDE